VLLLLALVTAPLLLLTRQSLSDALLDRAITQALTAEITQFPGSELVQWTAEADEAGTLYLDVTLRVPDTLSYVEARALQNNVAGRLKRPVALSLGMVPATRLRAHIPPTDTPTPTPTHPRPTATRRPRRPPRHAQPSPRHADGYPHLTPTPTPTPTPPPRIRPRRRRRPSSAQMSAAAGRACPSSTRRMGCAVGRLVEGAAVVVLEGRWKYPAHSGIMAFPDRPLQGGLRRPIPARRPRDTSGTYPTWISGYTGNV
jgi:hypothetical protein